MIIAHKIGCGHFGALQEPSPVCPQETTLDAIWIVISIISTSVVSAVHHGPQPSRPNTDTRTKNHKVRLKPAVRAKAPVRVVLVVSHGKRQGAEQVVCHREGRGSRVFGPEALALVNQVAQRC